MREVFEELLRRLDRSLEIGLSVEGDRERGEACLMVSSTLSFKRPGLPARAGFLCLLGGVIGKG